MAEIILKLEGNNYEKLQRKRNTDKGRFCVFLQNLRKDYLENLSSWENRDIGAFLEAMASWVEDMDGFYINQGLPIPKTPNWRVFADILMGGKVYE